MTDDPHENEDIHDVEKAHQIAVMVIEMARHMVAESEQCPSCTFKVILGEMLGFLLYRLGEPVNSKDGKQTISELILAANSFFELLVKTDGRIPGPQVVVHAGTEEDIAKIKRSLGLDTDEEEADAPILQ